MHCHSSEPDIDKMDARRHSTQAGHKKDQKSSCCVTTHEGRVAPGPETRGLDDWGDFQQRAAEIVVLAPLPHALSELQAVCGDPPGVWRLATGARVSGTPGPGNSVGSTGEAGSRGCIRGAGRPASRGDAH